jgi:hypothetical protein
MRAAYNRINPHTLTLHVLHWVWNKAWYRQGIELYLSSTVRQQGPKSRYPDLSSRPRGHPARKRTLPLSIFLLWHPLALPIRNDLREHTELYWADFLRIFTALWLCLRGTVESLQITSSAFVNVMINVLERRRPFVRPHGLLIFIIQPVDVAL